MNASDFKEYDAAIIESLLASHRTQLVYWRTTLGLAVTGVGACSSFEQKPLTLHIIPTIIIVSIVLAPLCGGLLWHGYSSHQRNTTLLLKQREIRLSLPIINSSLPELREQSISTQDMSLMRAEMANSRTFMSFFRTSLIFLVLLLSVSKRQHSFLVPHAITGLFVASIFVWLAFGSFFYAQSRRVIMTNPEAHLLAQTVTKLANTRFLNSTYCTVGGFAALAILSSTVPAGMAYLYVLWGCLGLGFAVHGTYTFSLRHQIFGILTVPELEAERTALANTSTWLASIRTALPIIFFALISPSASLELSIQWLIIGGSTLLVLVVVLVAIQRWRTVREYILSGPSGPKLACQRTALANTRTMLAFFRLGLTLAATAFGFAVLYTSEADPFAIIFGVFALVCFVNGILLMKTYHPQVLIASIHNSPD